MPKLSTRGRQARARLAAATARAQRDPSGQAEVEERRRDFRFVVAEDYVRELVDAAPPLTDDQRRRLAAILTGG